MKYVLGIDLGTSGTKTVLFDENGQELASALYEYPLYQPQNGWAEQNPSDWWDAAVSTIRQVLSGGNIDAKDVVSLGISGQMHGLVMLDEKGEVLRPSIIWSDQRTAAECEEMTRLVGADRMMQITANPAMTGFTASKILWVRNHQPEIYARCHHILLPKDYVRYMLTGDFATEVSDASGMQVLDIANRCWSDEVLNALSIDKALLAKVYESPEVTGTVHEKAAALTGLHAGTLVVGGAGDNAACAVGTGVVKSGRAFTTIGTSGVVFAHTDTPIIDAKGRVHTFCCAVPGKWHVMGVTQAAGFSLRWFRDTFCAEEKRVAQELSIDEYDLLNQEAAKSPVGSNRLFYLPYLMGERTPHLDADARGAFVGLSGIHQKRDLLRAVMEGVGFSLKDCQSIFGEMNLTLTQMAACGGGAKSPIWRQMLANLFGCDISTVRGGGAALGVAVLAGVGAGIYPSVEQGCERVIHHENALSPDGDAAKYVQLYDTYRKFYPALKGLYKEMATL